LLICGPPAATRPTSIVLRSVPPRARGSRATSPNTREGKTNDISSKRNDPALLAGSDELRSGGAGAELRSRRRADRGDGRQGAHANRKTLRDRSLRQRNHGLSNRKQRQRRSPLSSQRSS